MSSNRPVIVVAALVEDEQGKLLMGKQKTKNKRDLYANPGGKVEDESITDAFWRELKEETNLKKPSFVCKPEFAGFSEEVSKTGERYLVMFYFIEYHSSMGEVINMEPNKCYGWEWIHIRELANRPVVSSIEKFLKNELVR